MKRKPSYPKLQVRPETLSKMRSPLVESCFALSDTAGLRETTDTIEAIGVGRTHEKMKSASLILYLFDMGDTDLVEINREINILENQGVPFLKVANKTDKG